MLSFIYYYLSFTLLKIVMVTCYFCFCYYTVYIYMLISVTLVIYHMSIHGRSFCTALLCFVLWLII